MANKITCTCGHSWDKSDSSKKDAYVCHICGKNIKNMQLGGNIYPASYVPQAEEGWLSKYEDGGSMQEHQENYNDSSVSMGPGFVGMGNNTKGRNYSPAWGGQFQDGGNLTFLEPTSRKLPKGYVIPYNTPSTELAMSIGGEGDEPAYLIPSFKYGKPLKDAVAEFRRTGEHLGGPFKTWQEADEWERTVRHPYVEKGQNIPTPIKRSGKDFAMGGSIPGAVGFTYARTQGIPSKGPHRNQTDVTDASAQNGKNVEYKELPEIVVVGGKDKPTIDLYRNELDKLTPISPEGNPYSGAAPFVNYYAKMQMAKEFGVPKVRPAEPIGKIESFFRNRSGIKSDSSELQPQYSPFTKTVYAGFDSPHDYKKEYIPELSHYVSQTKRKEYLGKDDYNKAALSMLWEYAKGNNPYNVEGTEENFAHKQIEPALRESYDQFREEGKKMFMEAADNSMKRKLYERNKKLQNGGEMSFYQNGLDWTPKNISRDGSVIKDDRGQWAHPGEITEIGSNQITMKGVPYPVLGVSDEGDTKMMYPEEDYKFKGKKVTEYPVKKNWLEKYK